MMTTKKSEVCTYAERLRKAARRRTAAPIRGEVEALCGCLEALPCDGFPASALVPELDRFYGRLLSCAGRASSEPCAGLREPAAGLVSHCRKLPV